MKNFATAAIALLAISLSQPASADSAIAQGPGGKWYQRIDTTLNWTQARDAAAARSLFGVVGHLATPLTEAEANAANSVRSGSCWIGGNDLAVEGNWVWVTGELFWVGGAGGSAQDGLYENWNGGEPNDQGGEDALEWTGGGFGGWNDLNVTSTRSCYLVQFDVGPRPVPLSPLAAIAAAVGIAGFAARRLMRKSA
ncbi:MAG: C-type lectin domain-containing protein [Chromatiales bacterium]|nr:C-type lectin domain-containing protein [Chromatiales bacterium]